MEEAYKNYDCRVNKPLLHLTVFVRVTRIKSYNFLIILSSALPSLYHGNMVYFFTEKVELYGGLK